MSNPHADLIARYRQAQDAMGGCTDGYCVVRCQKGMHTNGGCRCMYHPDHLTTQRAGHIMRLAQDMAEALESAKPEDEA